LIINFWGGSGGGGSGNDKKSSLSGTGILGIFGDLQYLPVVGAGKIAEEGILGIFGFYFAFCSF